jgi:hypothetical protein
MIGFDNLQPFLLGGVFVLWKSVVEKYFNGGLLAVIVAGVIRDKPDKAT